MLYLLFETIGTKKRTMACLTLIMYLLEVKMKKLIVAFLLIILALFLISCDNNTTNGDTIPTVVNKAKYAEWKESSDAQDINDDLTIDEKDYVLFLEFEAWLDTDDAEDLNQDRRINVLDFKINTAFKQWKKATDALDLDGDQKIGFSDYLVYQSYLTWKESDETIDLNDDKVITIDDYILSNNESYKNYVVWKNGQKSDDLNKDGVVDRDDYAIYLLFIDWLDSDATRDLNYDRIIDFNDYSISLNPTLNTYDRWVNSIMAQDLNDDKKIDEKDYELYQLFGTYSFSSYSYQGVELYLNDIDYSTTDFKNDIGYYRLEFSKSGVSVKIDDRIERKIGEEGVARIVDVFDKASVEVLTSNVISVDFSMKVEGINVPVSLYVRKSSDGLTSSFKFQYYSTSNSRPTTITISFTLTRV